MFSTIGVLAVLAGIAAAELPALFRQRQKREIAAYALLLAVGAFLCVCTARLVQLPSPLGMIESLFRPLVGR